MARGRKLFTPGQTNSIRPTADRAKEALFSILGDKIYSANVLDLYTGTGALGLEALSRGARQVVMVDCHQKALEIAARNYATCFQNIEDIDKNAAIIIKHDLRRGLQLRSPKSPLPEHFDIILLDPPYGKNLVLNSLKDIDNSSLLTGDTIIVAEEASEELLPDSFAKLFLSGQRKYGDTSFWFYKVKENYELK